MHFTLFELAKNKEFQNRVRKEINKVLYEYNGQVAFVAMNDMKLLDNALYGK